MTASPPFETAVVVGGGTMGAGIAQSLLEVGCRVTIVETSTEALAAAQERVATGLARTHRDDPEGSTLVAAELDRLSVAIDTPPEDVLPRKDVGLVIEAVPEDLELKCAVLAELALEYPQVLLASNTSSLSIATLAERVTEPARFLGMHFFNPVPRSDLVEIVIGPGTGEEAIAAAQRWVDRLDKTSIVVRDSPGFATSRLGLALGLEAIRMVEAGVASVDDIDRGMVLGYKHPIGPLRLTDLVGLDVRLGIAEHLTATLGPRFEPPALLRSMVADGALGKKTGRGFYEWA